MTIAVTGATGQLGRLIVEKLGQKVGAGRIVALARSPEKASRRPLVKAGVKQLSRAGRWSSFARRPSVSAGHHDYMASKRVDRPAPRASRAQKPACRSKRTEAGAKTGSGAPSPGTGRIIRYDDDPGPVTDREIDLYLAWASDLLA